LVVVVVGDVVVVVDVDVVVVVVVESANATDAIVKVDARPSTTARVRGRRIGKKLQRSRSRGGDGATTSRQRIA
jgi:hypothetical protein